MDKHIIKKTIYRAIRNIIDEGCTDVTTFSRPFELDYLRDSSFQDKIVDKIANSLDDVINNNGKLEKIKVKKISYMLVPKKSFYDFRKCALIEIEDEIKYLSIVLLIADEIEKKRLRNNIVFSYRFINKYTSDKLFDKKKYNYTAFKTRTKELSSLKKYNVMIECDISNFYDRLNLHRLNSTLLSINEIDPNISHLIDQLLLFWANRDSYSIPVGSNASRILAEAFLIEIDNYLITNNIVFCRFVDDYRFFAKNVDEANKILSSFVTILYKHGLSINLGKTNFVNIKYYKKEEKNNKLTKEGIGEIIRGYSGLVPTKFRKISEKEKEQLKNNDYLLFEKIKNDVLLDPNDIKKCIRIILAKEDYEKLSSIPGILKKYPQFIPYFSDALIKYDKFINEVIHKEIIQNFNAWLDDENLLEYITISIVKIYNPSNPEEKKILFDYFKKLKRNSGVYIARTILEHIGEFLTRGDILDLKDYYLRSDSFEKRQIVKIAIDGLSYQENRPFFKDIEMNCDDSFMIEMIDKYMKKYK